MRHLVVACCMAGLVTLLAAATPAAAHDLPFTDVTLTLRADGVFQVDLVADLDALALGVDATASDSAELARHIQALDPSEQARLVEGLDTLLKRRLRVRFDGEPAPFEVALPERGRRGRDPQPSELGLVARLEGRVPPGARAVSFFASRAFPPVRLRVVGPDGAPRADEVLERGGTSTPVPLQGPAVPATRTAVARRFLALGFTHILPRGLDHVLFVLGLALLTTRPGPLLAQVSAFTLAHTLALALAVYGVVALPARVVEPLIALSIVYVAVENIWRLAPGVNPGTQPSRLRLLLVFTFGLLHGMGFAGVLTDLGWPQGRRLLALVAFNAGVELGQVAVIALAVAALAGADRLGLPRRRVVKAVSAAIALVALVWTVQRVLPV